MPSITQKAGHERVLFMVGVRTPKEIIAWADRTICEEERPDELLIDLSTTSPDRFDDLLASLTRLAAGCDFWRSARSALGEVHDYLVAHPEEAERIAQALESSISGNLRRIPDDCNWFAGVEDAFVCAKLGIYGDLESARDDFIRKLGRFKKEPGSIHVA